MLGRAINKSWIRPRGIIVIAQRGRGRLCRAAIATVTRLRLKWF